MDKSMIKGIAVGGIAMVVLGAGAVTGFKTMMKPEFAEVVAVKEVTETVVTPHETCEDVQVQHRAPVKDEHRVAGTVVSEQALLDLEREAFLSLCGNLKTQDRMQYMLKNGKALRN